MAPRSTSRVLLLVLVLVLSAAPCNGTAAAMDPRPDPEPLPALSATAEPQAEFVDITTARPLSEVDALTDVEPTTTTTTTTTTTPAPTTTSAAPSTVGGINLGGGLLSNAIAGGGSTGGGGLLSLLGNPANGKPKEKGPEGNFDTYLDTILGNLGKTLRQNGFDPIPLGNILQCRNCSMEGLSLLRRVGPSNLVYANRTLNVDAHLGIPALYISCFPCVEVVLMVPFTGMLEVALWDLQIYGKVSQKTTKGANPSLDEYRVVREGDLDMSLNGYGLLGPMAEVGFKILHQRQISVIIREFVYEKVPNFISEKLKGFSFPIGKR